MFKKGTGTEYKCLLTANTLTRKHCSLLRCLVSEWGQVNIPPQTFKKFTSHHRHPLSICLRQDPVPPINQKEGEFLMTLFQLYGPLVIHPDRVVQAVKFLYTNNLTPEQTLHVHYASKSTQPVNLDDVYMNVMTTVIPETTYHPSWNNATPLVPFVSTQYFEGAFNRMSFGCLKGMPWNGVIAAGEAVASCLVLGPRPNSSGFSTMPVELFVSSSVVMIKTMKFFKDKFGEDVMWGLKGSTVVICIRSVPRVFHIVPVLDTDQKTLVSSFDLEFMQVYYTGEQVFMTPICIRTHATRVCNVCPFVLPNRQFVALEKGFGLCVWGLNSIPQRTFWDASKTYVPSPTHSTHQITYNMHLNLGCHHVSDNIITILNIMANNSNVRENTEPWFTGAAFLTCGNTCELMINTLAPILPAEGTVGYLIPYPLKFQNALWLYSPAIKSIILNHDETGYSPHGMTDIGEFLGRLQVVFDFMYGQGSCVYNFGQVSYLPVSTTPNCRIVNTLTHKSITMDQLEKVNMTKHAICAALECSTLLVGTNWWTPVFTISEMDVFDTELVMNMR